jgi:hypothetical protein
MSDAPEIVEDLRPVGEENVKKDIQPKELQKMRPHHRTIAILAAQIPKLTTAEIAEMVGFSQQSIARLLNSPLMEAEIARLQGDMEAALKATQMKIVNLADRSIQIIEENLGDPDIGIDPMVDRAAMTQDAWKVYEAAMGGRKGGGGISVNVQVANFAKEAKDMDEKEITEILIGEIRDRSKA